MQKRAIRDLQSNPAHSQKHRQRCKEKHKRRSRMGSKLPIVRLIVLYRIHKVRILHNKQNMRKHQQYQCAERRPKKSNASG